MSENIYIQEITQVSQDLGLEVFQMEWAIHNATADSKKLHEIISYCFQHFDNYFYGVQRDLLELILASLNDVLTDNPSAFSSFTDELQELKTQYDRGVFEELFDYWRRVGNNRMDEFPISAYLK